MKLEIRNYKFKNVCVIYFNEFSSRSTCKSFKYTNEGIIKLLDFVLTIDDNYCFAIPDEILELAKEKKHPFLKKINLQFA
jgi:hypothetical protein